MTYTVSPTAVMNNSSAPSVYCTTTRAASQAMSRRRIASRVIRDSLSSSSGRTNPAVKLRCPLACDTIAGANPQNRPPATAVARDRARWRENTQYHAYAVPARLTVSAVTNDTEAPKISVTGVSTMP
jgi:hypothetical protein